MGQVRVYVASSLDGFIAGPEGDLSWLPQSSGDPNEDFGWSAFLAQIGCLLMGRTTYDAVVAMGIDWPYGDLPTLIATHRPWGAPPPPGVSATHGSIADLIALARERAGDRDVYLDGGTLIRQALDAGLVDDIVVTLCPVVLGAGEPLFAGVEQRRPLALRSHRELPGGLVQVSYAPTSAAT